MRREIADLGAAGKMKRLILGLGVWLLWSAAGEASPKSPQATSGSPDGLVGIRVTVSELMALEQSRAPAAKPLASQRRMPILSKTAPGVGSPGPSAPLLASKPVLSPEPRTPQVAGTLFNGDSASAGVVTPPDSMGAVGPTQFLVCTNYRIQVFSKSGALGPLSMSTDTFFSPVLGGTTMADPRVRFDRNTNRWFVTAISTSPTNNRLMVAVSDGPTILGSSSFTLFFVPQNLVAPAGDDGLFADYPTLGVDVNALYLSCSMFNGNTFSNTSCFVIQKSSLLGSGPMQITAFRGLIVGGSGMITAQGVDNDDPAATEGYFIAVDAALFGKLVMRRISAPGSATPTISGDIPLSVPVTAYPMGVTTAIPGVVALQSNALDDLDDRLFMAQIRSVGGTPFLWTCHNIGVTSTGVASNTPDRDAVRWYKIGSFTGTPTLSDSGTFYDNQVSGQSYWIPSLNVSGQGHMVLACNFAKGGSVGTGQYVGAMISGHLATDAAGVTQPATLIDESSSGYYPSTPSPDGMTKERWGDYSYTSLDPADDMTLWTTQEFAVDGTHWGVRVIQIKAPQPATPQSASPSSIAAGQASVSVTITGSPPVQSEGWFDPGPGFPNRISGLLHSTLTLQNIGINSITVIDPLTLTLDLNTVGITPSTFNLTITNPDGQSRPAGSILTVTAGTGAPSCILTGPASPTNANPINFTATFSEVMNGNLVAGDFVITNATGPVLTGSGPSYNLAVTPTGQGVVTCRLPAGSATGSGTGLPNTASNTASVSFDSIAPSVTITPFATPTNQNPVFNLTFSENVTGLVPGSFALSSGSVGSLSGSGRNYVVTVTGASQGLLTITLPGGSVTDTAGNGNTAGSSSATYDSVPPSVTVTPPAASTRLNPIPFTVMFSEPVTGLTLPGITVTGGGGILTGTGASYTVNVSPTGQGTVTVQVQAGQAADAAGNLNLVSNVGIAVFDTVPPGTSILTAPSDPSGSSSATFTFSSTEPGSSFEVQMDGGSFTANGTGTQTYTCLGLGIHTFTVAAVDAAGNVDPIGASYTWSIPIILIDGVAPVLNPFDSSAFLANWTISPPTGTVGWAADATPATILGAPSFVTAPASLNYNDGTDYVTGSTANTGSARSPQIDRTALPGTLRLKFMCNYQTDTTATATDQRTVTIWKGDLSGTWTAPIQLSGGVTALGACSPMGTWHEHTLDLQPTWTPDLRVEFNFNTVDNVNNTGAGWFVDDFEISDLVISSIHQYVAGTTTVIPVGGTTSAGAVEFRGAVSRASTGSARLEVEVQPVATPFTGTPTVTGTGSAPGAVVVTTPYTIPALGDYHVRVRSVDISAALTSGWMEFGLNAVAAPDFTQVAAPAVAASGGGGGGGGCGATGLEGLLIALFLWVRRRRT